MMAIKVVNNACRWIVLEQQMGKKIRREVSEITNNQYEWPLIINLATWQEAAQFQMKTGMWLKPR